MIKCTFTSQTLVFIGQVSKAHYDSKYMYRSVQDTCYQLNSASYLRHPPASPLRATRARPMRGAPSQCRSARGLAPPRASYYFELEAMGAVDFSDRSLLDG